MPNLEKNIITRSFDVLAQDLGLSFTERTSVGRCQASIETYLGEFITTFTTELSGAFARETMISPLDESVIDMLVLFRKGGDDKFTPMELLHKLEVTLRAKYPSSTYDAEAKAIYVPIENFKFKIQPGFMTSDSHYLIPALSTDIWLDYDLLGYKKQFIKENISSNGKMIHVIRMMKMWNRLSGNRFDNYFIELLVRDALSNHIIESYPETINHIFKIILYDVALKQHDPANVSIKIQGLRDLQNVVDAMLHVKSAYMVSKQALEFEEKEDMVSAMSCWKKLLPVAIPD